MSVVDAATGETLPSHAIQRVMFVCHPVHVYAIPPLASMKGYTAADWTAPDPQNEGKTRQIFTARLRVLETAIPVSSSPSAPSQHLGATSSRAPATDQEKVKTDILLEDPSCGSLFAAAPYTDESAVEHVVDSSRFFALRVVGDGKKAVLGIGFEDRSEAFDFGVTLQEAQKVLGFGGPTDTPANSTSSSAKSGPQPPRAAPAASAPRGPQIRAPRGRMAAPANAPSRSSQQSPPAEKAATPKDYSLKPGQTITIDIGGSRGGVARPDETKTAPTTAQDENEALFSIPPPPGSGTSQSGGNTSGALPYIAPPPSGREERSERRKSSGIPSGKKSTDPADNTFDDDEFGDFQ